MRKGRDGGKKREKTGKKKENTDENSGLYVIASSRPPDRRPLERRTLEVILDVNLYRLCFVNKIQTFRVFILYILVKKKMWVKNIMFQKMLNFGIRVLKRQDKCYLALIFGPNYESNFLD